MKQRAGLKDGVSRLNQESLKPTQAAVDAVRDAVSLFQTRLTASENIAGEKLNICLQPKLQSNLFKPRTKHYWTMVTTVKIGRVDPIWE